jgi:putative component of membrane protein insertase Oxa1/YidC/SpoIIIJ protein YidD
MAGAARYPLCYRFNLPQGTVRMSPPRSELRYILHYSKRPYWVKMTFIVLLSCAFFGCAHSSKERPTETGFIENSSPIFSFYRGPLNHLSAVRRGECPMTPSCSEYARQAFEKHGPIVGWIITMDRLLRCGRDEVVLAQQKMIDGKWKAFDPVENNDFWWARPPAILSLPNLP